MNFIPNVEMMMKQWKQAFNERNWAYAISDMCFKQIKSINIEQMIKGKEEEVDDDDDDDDEEGC